MVSCSVVVVEAMRDVGVVVMVVEVGGECREK